MPAELPRLLSVQAPACRAAVPSPACSPCWVEGDDTNEPIADAVRGILDGHIVLDREIAQRGRYPAINILKSVSRMLPDANSEYENQLSSPRAGASWATMENMAELIRPAPSHAVAPTGCGPCDAVLPAARDVHQPAREGIQHIAEGYDQLAKVLGVTEESRRLTHEIHGHLTPRETARWMR